MGLLLSLLAIALFVWGVVNIVQGAVLFGIVLIIVACLVGPGGYSVFRR